MGNLAGNKTKSLHSRKLTLTEYARQEVSKMISESDTCYVRNTQRLMIVMREGERGERGNCF